jgi:hypothetical protein
MQTTTADTRHPLLTLAWIAGGSFALGFFGYLLIGLNTLPG